jgi:hypothetical protein
VLAVAEVPAATLASFRAWTNLDQAVIVLNELS